MKRTPLKQTGTLKRTPLARGGNLRPRSEATQKIYTEQRIPVVKQILAERPYCQACPIYAAHDGRKAFKINNSKDCHEINSRSSTGGVHSTEWLDPNNILAVCRQCHIRIGDFPAEAKSLGLTS